MPSPENARGTAKADKAQVFIDWLSSGTAAVIVSPLVAAIDRAITQNAAGTHTVMKSFRQSMHSMLTRPHRYFVKADFWLLWTVYTTTYGTANSFDTWYKHRAPSVTQYELTKVFGVSIVNTLGCIWKDRAFARIYGTIPPARLPAASYAIWFIRDSSVIAASFSFPPNIAKYAKRKGMNENYALLMAQFGGPVFSMTWATALHLLGLDFYNNRTSTWQQRMAFLRRTYLPSLIAKSIRIIPPFALGPSTNHFVRKYWMNKRYGDADDLL